jgi:hypothetical protein
MARRVYMHGVVLDDCRSSIQFWCLYHTILGKYHRSWVFFFFSEEPQQRVEVCVSRSTRMVAVDANIGSKYADFWNSQYLYGSTGAILAEECCTMIQPIPDRHFFIHDLLVDLFMSIRVN